MKAKDLLDDIVYHARQVSASEPTTDERCRAFVNRLTGDLSHYETTGDKTTARAVTALREMLVPV